MTTTTPNTRSAQENTADKIQANIAKAQNSFVLSKDSAAEAAAHTYIVFDETQSENADPDAKAWMEKQIDERNTAIDNHNKLVVSDKKRAGDFKAGTLSKDDVVNSQPTNDADRKIVAEERAKLTHLSTLTNEEWAERRKVRVGARANANDFTSIVKFVLNLDNSADASITSRFATVLEWIHAHFTGVEIHDASQIVAAIKDAGGFEVALNKQRGNRPGGSGGESGSEEREIIEKAVVAKAKEAVQTAAAMATIDMHINNAQENIVLLIGRYAYGKVEVVDNIPMESGELESMVSRVSDDLVPPNSETVEFIAHVLELGDLVAEGRITNHTQDGTVTGKKLEEQRALSLLPDNEGNTQLVISALYADSSAVIRAIPEPSRINFGKAPGPIMLPSESGRVLQKMLRDHANRRLLDIVVDEPTSADGELGQSALSWTTSNSALIAEDHANAVRKFSWEDMRQREFRPLDIDNFHPQFSVAVSAADLADLYRERLKTWQGKVDGKKSIKTITLRFHDASITYKVEGDRDLTISCNGTINAAASLQFRPRDLHDLVLKLTQQNIKTFDFEGDEGGLLRVSWSDHLGSYSVYMPTSTTDGRQQQRRVSPMRMSLSKQAAA